jgi:hypothetical protein
MNKIKEGGMEREKRSKVKEDKRERRKRKRM